MVLSDARDGITMESKTIEPDKESVSSTASMTSEPWQKPLQPLSSNQGLVPKESSVISYSTAVNTHHSELPAVKPDLKGVMKKRHSHAGVFYQNFHQSDVAFDMVPAAPKLALLTEIAPNSIKPQMPPIPKSLSLDRIPSLRHLHFSESKSGALNYKPSYRPHVAGTETLRKRDELASVFRSLDGEFQK